jgi:hypothetical protein
MRRTPGYDDREIKFERGPTGHQCYMEFNDDAEAVIFQLTSMPQYYELLSKQK